MSDLGDLAAAHQAGRPERQHDEDKEDTLLINSSGGSVEGGLAGGRWLRENHKMVKVNGNCLSACVYVLAGGICLEMLADMVHCFRLYPAGWPQRRKGHVTQPPQFCGDVGGLRRFWLLGGVLLFWWTFGGYAY
jgi:hypothetical protein